MSESNGKKLIQEVISENVNNETTKSTLDEEVNDSVESKPISSKRTYLDVTQNADKYKPFMLKQLETKKFRPSEALIKVRDFLPFFKESTSKLLDQYKENPNELNIENVQEDEEHIEMNLAVVSESESDEDEDDDDDDDDDEDYDDEDGESDESNDNDDESEECKNSLEDINLDIKVKDMTKLTKIKLPKTNSKKPTIQVIDQNDDNSTEKNSEDKQNEVEEESNENTQN